MPRVFISHSTADRAEAIVLRDWLAAQGWGGSGSDLPGRGIPNGNWQDALVRTVSDCDIGLFLISSSWLASSFTRREFDLARQLGKKLLVVLIEPVGAASLLADLQEAGPLFDLTSGAGQIDESVADRGDPGRPVAFSPSGLARLRDALMAIERRAVADTTTSTSAAPSVIAPDPRWRFIDDLPAAESVPQPARRKAALLIEKLSAVRPDICDLACLASIAVQVEPFLLRRLRLRFIPGSDASLEADLAFSQLATGTTGGFLELAPIYVESLRGRLAASGWLDAARGIIDDAHQNLSAAIRLEEKATYLTIRQPQGWRTQVRDLLGQAAKAAESRDNVARWAHRALRELPAAVRETEGYWVLAKTASARIGSSPPAGALPASMFGRVSGLLGDGPTVEIGVARDRDDLLFTVPPTESGFVISAPLTQPVALVVTTADGERQVTLDAQSGSAFSKLPGAARGAVTVETLARDTYEIPESVTAPPQAPAYERERDRHLFEPGPKRILALDGSGIRSVVTIAFLERIETLLSKRLGDAMRLSDEFDLIGGASTGALLATMLALGRRADELRNVFFELIPRLAAGSSRALVETMVRERDLDNRDLVTGLAIAMKRMDVARPWIVANNLRAPYWSSAAGSIGDKNLKLSSLLHASMAKLGSLELEQVQIREDGPVEMFVDAAFSPYKNPSLALFQMATRGSYGIEWPWGPDQLLILSIGSGSYRPRVNYRDLGFARASQLAEHSVRSLAADAETLTIGQMQWLGESPQAWTINSEVGTLAGDGPPGGKRFRFVHYNLRLETQWMREVLGITVSAQDIERFLGGKDLSAARDLYSLAQVAAEKQVRIEHFGQG
jgi:hypothetical protein